MRWSAFFLILVAQLSLAIPTATEPELRVRGDIENRGQWWEDQGWRGGDQVGHRVKPSQPVPSTSGRTHRHHVGLMSPRSVSS